MDFSGFYKQTIENRWKILKNHLNLNSEQIELLKKTGHLSHQDLDKISENVIGHFDLPFSILPNLRVNGKDYIVPMVIEEPSVVAAASKMLKITLKSSDGFIAEPIKSIMIGQIQIITSKKPQKNPSIIEFLNSIKEEILKVCNSTDNTLFSLGGGAEDIEIRQVKTQQESFVILHVLINVKDAMGANIVNTMMEKLAKYLESQPMIRDNAKIGIKILSNLSIHRVAKVSTVLKSELLGGPNIVNRMIKAYNFAQADPFRAATHNKGIMNGVVAVAQATGNDSRALEAGAHAFASLRHKIHILNHNQNFNDNQNDNLNYYQNQYYQPLSSFNLNKKGNLVAHLEIPMAVGIIGGNTQTHPMAKLALQILKVNSAEELSQVIACVGLAQNIAALRALSDEGIQKGHMKLHIKKFN